MSDGKKSNFTMTDNRVTEDERLGAYDILVYLALCHYASWKNRSKAIYPNQDTIAKKARCSKRTVVASLQKLEELGYIRAERRGGKTTNKYFLLDLQGAYSASHALQESSYSAGDAHQDALIVQEMHSNNSNTLNINNKQKTNNKKITAQSAVASSNTLFSFPKIDPPAKKTRIEIAQETRDWSNVTSTDFVQYFIQKQNEIFPTQIQFVKGKEMNYSVSTFRKNFIDRYDIPPDETCEMIDSILQAYKQTETDARYRDCFSLDTFRLDWKVDMLMQRVKNLEKYGTHKTTGTTAQNLEVF